MKLIILGYSLLVLVRGDTLGALVSGLTPVEKISVNGKLVEGTPPSCLTISRDPNGLLNATIVEGSLQVNRSTGIQMDTISRLEDIIENAVGNKYRILASLKNGGRILTERNERLLDYLIDSQSQKQNVFIEGKIVNEKLASVVSRHGQEVILEPQGFPNVRIIRTGDGVTVATRNETRNITVTTSKGLTPNQVNRLRDNFSNVMAERIVAVTGLPIKVVAFLTSGRDRIISRLLELVPPLVDVEVDGVRLDLGSAERTQEGYHTLERNGYPTGETSAAYMVKGENGSLSVVSPTGGTVKAVYSTGVTPALVATVADSLHRAITLRVNLISWSNKLLGSVPPELETALSQIRSLVQKRRILVDGKEVDLRTLGVVSTDKGWTIYRLPRGGLSLRVTQDTVTLIGQGYLEVRLSSGVPRSQADKLEAAVKEILKHVFPSYSNDYGDQTESIFDGLDKRKIISALVKGIVPEEWVRAVGQLMNLTGLPFVKKTADRSEYGNPDNVTIHRYENGDFGVETKRGTKVQVFSSTGLTVAFLDELANAMEELGGQHFKRSIGMNSKVKHFAKLKVISLVKRIPSLVQNVTVLLNGRRVDLEQATILSTEDEATVYRPQDSSTARVTLMVDGSVSLDAPREVATVTLERGITLNQADLLLNNIKTLLGNNVDINGLDYPCDEIWPNPAPAKRDTLVTLVSEIVPSLNVTGEADVATATSGKRDLGGKSLKVVKTKFGGVNATTDGRQIKLAFSSGLSVASTRPLVEYVDSLLKDKQDVINMNLGTLSGYKERRLKEEIQKLGQKRSVYVDDVRMTRSNSKREVDISSNGDGKVTSYRPEWAPDVNVKLGEDNVDVVSDRDHVVNVVVSQGLTPAQIKQLEENVQIAFKKKLSQITKIPFEVLDIVSGTRERLVQGLFHLAAPPCESILVNGSRIDSLSHDSPTASSLPAGGRVMRYSDGGLGVETSSPIRIEVVRSTGVDKEDAQKILSVMREYVAARVKSFAMVKQTATSEVLIHSLEQLLQNSVAVPSLSLNGTLVDLSTSLVSEKSKKVTSYRPRDGLTLSHFSDGRILVESHLGENTLVNVNISRGISKKQADYLEDVLKGILEGKLEKLEIIANLPSLLLRLLAQGKLKPVQEVIEAAVPQETIIVDGRSMSSKTITAEGSATLYEPTYLSGVKVMRHPNGTLDVSSGKGGSITLASNSGLSSQLVNKITEELKKGLGEKLTPIINLLNDLVKGNFSDIVDVLWKTDLRNINSWIKSVNLNSDWVDTLVSAVTQNHTIFIDSEEINLSSATVLSSDDTRTIYSPKDHPLVRIIHQHGNGSVTVETAGGEEVRVTLTVGMPQSKAQTLIQGVRRLMNLFQSLDTTPDKVYSTVFNLGEKLFSVLSKGLAKEEEIFVDGKLLTENNLLKVDQEKDLVSYQVEGQLGVLVTRFNGGNLSLETSGNQELEVYTSSGLTKELMTHLASTLQSLNVTMENVTHMVTNDVYLRDSPLYGVFDSLLQSRQVYIGKVSVNLGGPGWSGENSQAGRKVFVDSNGRVTVLGGDEAAEVEVGPGLSPLQLRRLRANLGSLFRPDKVLAAALDAVPDRVYAAAANLERIIPFLGLFDF